MASRAKRSGKAAGRPSSRGGRTRQRVRRERQSLYRHLVAEAAERIFARKGSGPSRMQEVAAEAGLSLATIYEVVDGKNDLLAAVHERRMREFLDRIRAARDAHHRTLEAHLAVLLDGADFFLEHPDFLRLCCRDGYGWASGATSTESGAELWEQGIRVPSELFARGIAEGLYVDEPPALLARKMLALKQVELAHWVEGGMRAPAREVRTRLERQFLRAFCRPGVEPDRSREEPPR